MLRWFSGASVKRVVDRSLTRVPEHAHDWPVLSLFVMGSYSNRTEGGEISIAVPSAVLYRAAAAHQNTVGPAGFEQIEIEFDPAWLGHELLPDVPVSRWLGGRAGAQARSLAKACCDREIGEARLRAAVRRFVGEARREPPPARPSWMGAITRRLKGDASVKVADLAREAERHASWVGTAYKRATGEGLRESAARFRVERAAQLLRETDMALADIAIEGGFCDQSHMNRTFRRLLGRTPGTVRDDRRNLRSSHDEGEPTQ